LGIDLSIQFAIADQSTVKKNMISIQAQVVENFYTGSGDAPCAKRDFDAGIRCFA
jgi:hypothetical protein